MKKILSFILITLCLSVSLVFSSSESDYSDIFQEATDKHFSDIDDKIEQYLSNLNDSKNHCFWKDKKQNFVECINDMERIFDDYSSQYLASCWEILSDTIKNSEKKSISVLEANKFIDSRWKNLCTRMYELKIRVSKSAAYEILWDNKLQILKDENKLFTQEQRTKYSDLLDIIRVNLWYVERLWKKWPSKTKK